MHTIKGSSSMMEYKGISEVAHKTEDLFALIRSSGLDMAHFSDLFDVVLAVSDFLKTEVDKVQNNEVLEEDVGPLTAVVLALTDKMKGNGFEEHEPDLGRMMGGPPDPEPAPDPPPMPVPPSVPEPVNILPPEEYMPEAPEGGRILGAEPPPEAYEPTTVYKDEEVEESPEEDELAADLAKIAERAAADQTAQTAPGGTDTYFLHVHFNEGSKMENIRAFMLVNKLAEKGTVNRTIPANPESDPDAGNRIVERGFYVSYTTTLMREQIETLVKGTLSVEAVSFVRRLPDDAGDAGGASEPVKPEPRPQPIVLEDIPPETAPQAQPEPAPQPRAQVPSAPRRPRPRPRRQIGRASCRERVFQPV
jgi:two-component system chemotaxis sensor kinase CheA